MASALGVQGILVWGTGKRSLDLGDEGPGSIRLCSDLSCYCTSLKQTPAARKGNQSSKKQKLNSTILYPLSPRPADQDLTENVRRVTVEKVVTPFCMPVVQIFRHPPVFSLGVRHSCPTCTLFMTFLTLKANPPSFQTL